MASYRSGIEPSGVCKKSSRGKLRRASATALSAKSKPLMAFANMIADLRGMVESGKPLSEVYYELLQQSGYLTMLEAGGFKPHLHP